MNYLDDGRIRFCISAKLFTSFPHNLWEQLLAVSTDMQLKHGGNRDATHQHSIPTPFAPALSALLSSPTWTALHASTRISSTTLPISHLLLQHKVSIPLLLFHTLPKAALNIFSSGFSYPTSDDMITASNLQQHQVWYSWSVEYMHKHNLTLSLAKESFDTHRSNTLRSLSSFLKRESKLDTTASLTARLFSL